MISSKIIPYVFPVCVLTVFLVLVTYAIHGSSIGIYQNIFYGNTIDNSLLMNSPQSIRSDEWLVSTQKTIAQVNGGLRETNPNIGNGENEAFISDAPALGAATIFKPHNFGFFFLPTENAFAFKWWLPLALLAISTYLLSLFILPNKYLLSSISALLFAISPFFMWWYSFGVTAVVFLAFFGTLALLKLFEAKSTMIEILWSLLFVYSGISFTLVLYPPFQIPVAIALAAFCVGYLVNKQYPKEIAKKKLLLVGCNISAVAVSVVLLLIHYSDVVSALSNSSYPGQRVVESGGYHVGSLLSGYSQVFLQYTERGVSNQSESSNFILLLPVLLVVLSYYAVKKYKKYKEIDFVTVSLGFTTILFLSWMFVPNIDFLGTVTLLNKVPQSRMLIGVGVINLLSILWFMKIYSQKEAKLTNIEKLITVSVAIIFFVISTFIVNFTHPPQFILPKEVFILAIVMASIVLLLVWKRFILATSLLLIFTLVSTWQIHPLYKGLSILTDNKLSTTIKEVSARDDRRWVSDDIYIENFPAMNGVREISGTYLYPQTDLWRSILPDKDFFIYNRYAHVNFSFDRNPSNNIATDTELIAQDQFIIKIEPCSEDLRKLDVGHIITASPIDNRSGPCLSLQKTIRFATRTYYIYSIE